jgi:hypothetical protein
MNDKNPASDQPPAGSERRVARILRQAKRESSARDLVHLATGSTWSALWILGATFVTAAGKLAAASLDR